MKVLPWERQYTSEQKKLIIEALGIISIYSETQWWRTILFNGVRFREGSAVGEAKSILKNITGATDQQLKNTQANYEYFEYSSKMLALCQ